MSLPIGHYTIRATNSDPLRTTATTPVDVSTTPISVTITVDSGIR
jgi:hypothetical protein